MPNRLTIPPTLSSFSASNDSSIRSDGTETEAEPLVHSIRELWTAERARRVSLGLDPSPPMPRDPEGVKRGKGGEECWEGSERFRMEIKERERREREELEEKKKEEEDGERGKGKDEIEEWERLAWTTFESTEMLWAPQWRTLRPLVAAPDPVVQLPNPVSTPRLALPIDAKEPTSPASPSNSQPSAPGDVSLSISQSSSSQPFQIPTNLRDSEISSSSSPIPRVPNPAIILPNPFESSPDTGEGLSSDSTPNASGSHASGSGVNTPRAYASPRKGAASQSSPSKAINRGSPGKGQSQSTPTKYDNLVQASPDVDYGILSSQAVRWAAEQETMFMSRDVLVDRPPPSSTTSTPHRRPFATNGRTRATPSSPSPTKSKSKSNPFHQSPSLSQTRSNNTNPMQETLQFTSSQLLMTPQKRKLQSFFQAKSRSTSPSPAHASFSGSRLESPSPSKRRKTGLEMEMVGEEDEEDDLYATASQVDGSKDAFVQRLL